MSTNERGEKICLHSWVGAGVPGQCLYQVEPSCRDGPESAGAETGVPQRASLLAYSQDNGIKRPSSWRMLWMLFVSGARLRMSCKNKAFCSVQKVAALGILPWKKTWGRRKPKASCYELFWKAEVLWFENIQQINCIESHFTSSWRYTCINGRYLSSY